MPIQQGVDKRGFYFRWGYSGKKYYYVTNKGMKIAKGKAAKQGKAIHANN